MRVFEPEGRSQVSNRDEGRGDWRATVALLFILTLAAGLRATGLSWGLRQAPESDEALFVRSVVEMIRHHDLEQRFYEYPGLFFHLLRSALVWLPDELLSTARAYLVARAVVVGFSVLSVALSYRLAARLVSPRAGLVAALVLAASPTEVTTAHMVRPDVVLEAFALLLLLSLRLGNPSPRSDAVSGAALGAAGAVKVTGAALIPSLVLDRWLSPGPRWRGIVVAALASMLFFVAATPDLLMHPMAFLTGFRLQWGYHYVGVPGRELEPTLPFYLRTLWDGLGPVACILAGLGLWAARLRLRTWAPILVFPPTLLALLVTSEVHWSRLILPAFGVVSVMAGLGFETVARRLPWAAWTAVVAGSLLPLSASISFLTLALQPGTRDRALDWIVARVSPHGSVLTSVESLGLDRSRFEVFDTSGAPGADRRMAESVDAVILRDREADLFPTWPPALGLPSGSTVTGPPLVLFFTPDSVRRLRALVPAAWMRLNASSNNEETSLALDGRPDTYWRTAQPDRDGEWVEVTLSQKIRLVQIDLLLGARPSRAGRHLRLSAPDGAGVGASFRPPCTPRRTIPAIKEPRDGK